MSRLVVPSRENAPQASQAGLDAVHAKLGVVPNLFRLIASSPAVLTGFLGFSGALGKTLDARTRERIALAVAQINGCDYCLSAHTYLAQNLAKLDADEVLLNRKGSSGDPKADAAVRFAAQVTRTRGHVSDVELAAVRVAGFDDARIVEIIAIVAENCFTNFLNEAAKTDIDFPVVRAAELA